MTRGFHHLLSGCLLAAFVASTGVGQAQTQPGGPVAGQVPGGRYASPEVVSSAPRTIPATRLPSSMIGSSPPATGSRSDLDPMTRFSLAPAQPWQPSARWKGLLPDNNKAVIAGGGVVIARGSPTAPKAPAPTVPGGWSSRASLSPNGPLSQVVRLRDPAYALPSIGYNATVRNVSRFVVECTIWSTGRFGGVYAIGPGAQLDYPMETADAVIEMQCPDVRGGARLTGIAHGKRYIFKRKAVLPIQTGLTMLGPIEFYEVT